MSANIEELLNNIVQELMGVPRISRDDNLLDLGGNSLVAMRMASRLKEELSIDVPVSVILSDTTLGAIIDAIDVMVDKG